MANFSSKEIESQYNLIKILLSDKKKYSEAIKAIKKRSFGYANRIEEQA